MLFDAHTVYGQTRQPHHNDAKVRTALRKSSAALNRILIYLSSQ
jgi:hypothetical protein